MPFALQCVLYACCKDQAVTATLVKPDPHSAARKLVCVWPRYRAKSASSTIALPITAIGSALALPAIAALCTARNRQLAPMRWQSIRSNRGTVDVGVMTTRAQSVKRRYRRCGGDSRGRATQAPSWRGASGALLSALTTRAWVERSKTRHSFIRIIYKKGNADDMCIEGPLQHAGV